MREIVPSIQKHVAADAGPVRILCAANAAFAAPLCVMLVSLLMNQSKGRKIEIYVLATNIPNEDRRKIEDSIRRNCPGFDLHSLHWLSPSMETLQGLHLSHWAELEVYARLLAPHVLPEDFDRILYLDSDIVVLSDLSAFYDSLNESSSVHAVRDEAIGIVSEPDGVFNYAELGIDPQAHYFNSGVMLINLRRWREQNIAGQIFDYLRVHGSSVRLWDQGGLNAILHDSWTEIDPVWNQMHCILMPADWKKFGRPMKEWRRVKNHPKIVHYSGANKPWFRDIVLRYSFFFHYLRKTNYRNKFKGRRLEHIIGFRLNYFFQELKIKLFWKRDFKDIVRILKRFTSPGRVSEDSRRK